MAESTVPLALRCQWKKREGEKGVYDCPNCGCWTANLPLYKAMLCVQKDRRKSHHGRRRGDR